MRIHYTILLLLFLLSPVVINAQYYDTGQDPWNLKWMQIKTGKYTVIYPEKYGSEGIEFAKSLNMANSALGSLFPEKKFRLPVVIHNFTVESNGYVAWAPKRMEIFPTPEQNTIPLDPRSQLTLHELAHVMQMEALNSGTIKVLSYFFGQQITGAAASLLPLWFMEGDAVFSETVLSGSGRGRSPDFQKKLKAIAIEKNHFYKYDKMVCGSFRDYTPDHYQFGYQMVAWSLASSDLNLWNRIMKFTATEPFSVIPVNISLRSNINLTKKLLYDQTFDVLKNMWQKDIDASGAKPYEPLNPDKNNRYINYYSPVSAGKDSIIAIKTSLADPPVFVLIDPSKKTEKNIHTPGNIYPWFITYGNGRIVWVETTVDPRWANREYSVIKMKDLRTGIIKQLTHRSRFLAASVSPDGKRIAAVENTYDNKNSLVFLGTSDGEVQKSIPVPGNASIQEPRWSDDGKKITVIFLTDAGEGIMLYSQAENTWKTLVEAGRNDLQSAQVRNDSLFFTSSVSGVENGFLLTPSGKLLEITNSRFGANDMIVNGSEVLFSDYTSAGSNICSAMLPGKEKESWTSEKKGSFLADRFDIKPASPEETGKEYTPQPYRKWQHLFGVHSWMPFYTDINAIETTPQTLRPGVVFLSQNLLSSLTATAGYEYSAEKRHMVHTNITWSGWYPVFQSQLDYGNESHFYHLSSSDPSPADTMSGYHFVNTISLPLAFSTGKFDQFLFLSASSDYQNNYIFISNSAGYDVGQLQLSGRILFYNYYKSAYRDIYPRWAQLIDFSYISSPYDQLFFGTDIYLKTAFYFPGFFHNNSIKLRFEGEQNNFSRYLTINRINFPRSYTNIVSGKLGVMSVDYEAPLFYPDFNISSVFYLTRIRGGLFYDRAIGYDNYSIETQNGNRVAVKQSSPEIFSSFGGELLADFHLFRIPYRISGGVQAAWKDIRKAPVFEMVFNMNINGTIIGKRPRL